MNSIFTKKTKMKKILLITWQVYHTPSGIASII